MPLAWVLHGVTIALPWALMRCDDISWICMDTGAIDVRGESIRFDCTA